MSAGNWKDMYLAAESGDLQLVRFYLELGVDPNYQHPEVMATVLFVSIKMGHAQIVELLLSYGADPMIKSILEGLDAWQVAQAYSQHEILDILDKI